jgi:hypothetical protein
MEILDEYVLGLKHYPVSKYDRAFEIVIRKDIEEEEILSMMETILISFPGTINKNLPSIELTLSADLSKATNCLSLTILLGVNASSKQRIIIIHCRSSLSTSKISFLSSSKPPQFVTFVDNIIDQCKAALETSGIADGPYNPTTVNNLDMGYVRDLQLVYGMDMLSFLTKMAETMDFHVKNLEKKCAKLMTMMKPNYTKAYGLPNGLPCIPIPPTKKSVSDYPLSLSRPTITEPNIEYARLLILRAKRALDQYYSSQSENKTWKKGNSAYAVDDLVAAISKELVLWVEEESKARTTRKTLAVKERVLALHEYRENLIWQLHTRFMRKYMREGPVLDGLVIVDKSIPLTAEDESFHEKCKSLCRVFCDEEPVILDLPVYFQGKKGTLYVSAGHLHFQPSMLAAPTIPSTWFGSKTTTQTASSATISLVQVKSISDISIRQTDAAADQLLIPNILASSSSAAALVTTTASSSEEIVLQIYNYEERITIQIPPLAGTGFTSADYSRRLADLLSILVKVRTSFMSI